MQAQSLLTLSEIAEHYRCSAKTFSKYVREYQIPFRRRGRVKLFDLIEVDRLWPKEIETIISSERPTRAKISRTVRTSKYADALGL